MHLPRRTVERCARSEATCSVFEQVNGAKLNEYIGLLEKVSKQFHRTFIVFLAVARKQSLRISEVFIVHTHFSIESHGW